MATENLDDVRTAVQPKFTRPAQGGAVFVLTITDGPDAGVQHTLHAEAPPVLLGQSPACELRLSDRTVSRRHASLEVDGDRVHLRDLGSTNGTRVDGITVDGAWLAGGETIRIGETVLSIGRGPSTAEGMPPVETRFGRIFGASASMRRIYPLCRKLASSDVPVILEGETGTGKEVLAESLHDEGARASGPFVVFDCTSVSPALMESELFGHERGAFTGAVARRKGLFEQAEGGTLLIDEIGDLEPALQPKLLRAVERGEIRRVGGDQWIHTNVRILSATRRDLDREVQEGRFRDDLFHRLAVTRVQLPPLRERAGDIGLLARHFWDAQGGPAERLVPALVAQWERRPWPGNVRELRNAVARHLALGDLETVDMTPAVAAPSGSGSDFLDDVVARSLPLIRGRELVVDEYERRYIARTVADHGGNIARAAEASGIARRHFQRLRARARRG